MRAHLPVIALLSSLCVAACAQQSGTAGTTGRTSERPATTAAAPRDIHNPPTPGISDGQQGVLEVFRAWNHAMATGDAAYACSLMTGPAQRKVHEGYNTTCQQALARASADLDQQEREALSNLIANGVTIDGDEASIRKSDVTPKVGAIGTFSFARQANRWYIDSIKEHD